MGGPSISAIMPALDEEGNLAAAVATVSAAFADRVSGHEIIVFDDGSRDRTGTIADALAREDPRVVVVHHPKPMGIGRCYWEGVRRARFEYVLMVPGDNEIPREALVLMVDHTGAADLVVPYFVNPWVRPLSRRLLSSLFTFLVNSLFSLNLRYYNGPCLIRTELVRSLPTAHDGFAYMAAILVRLALASPRVVEVGVPLGVRQGGRSKAVSFRNCLDVGRTLLAVRREIKALRRHRDSEGEPQPSRSGKEETS